MAEEELRGLTHLDGRQVIYSQQQTFIVGYIANMKASIALAKELFSEEGLAICCCTDSAKMLWSIFW